MLKIKKTFCACALLVAVSACHRIHNGTITNKYIVPAHSYQYSTMIIVGKVPITQWHTGWVGDEYILTVTNQLGKEKISEDFSVSELTYKCKAVGEYFSDTTPCEVYEPK